MSGSTGVCEATDAQPVDYILVTVFLQAEEAKPGVPDSGLVDQVCGDRAGPDDGRALRTLKLGTTPAGHVASGAERVRDGEEFIGVSKLINARNVVFVGKLMIYAHRELIQPKRASCSRHKVVDARAIWIGIQSQKSKALRAAVCWHLVIRKARGLVRGTADARLKRIPKVGSVCRIRISQQS